MDNLPKQSIVATKLVRPRAGRGDIQRTALLSRLDEGRDKRLTLISAPAGYGKSSLAIDWVERGSQPTAWVSLDEDDGDLNLFVGYIVAAIRLVFPDSMKQTAGMLRAREVLPAGVLSKSLVNEIEEIHQSFALVVDDYHFVRNPEIHALLDSFLRYSPTRFRLVLITRRDPPLDLYSLRLHNQISEIRHADLKLAPGETARIVKAATGKEPSIMMEKRLEEITEGWIAGLQLIILSSSSAGTGEAEISGNIESPVSHVDAFVRKILSMQSPENKEFLQKSALLDHFCVPLTLSLCQPGTMPDANGIVEWLQVSNLFIISLDTNAEWFRFHHLFRDSLRRVLREEMDATEILQLHLKAAGWFEEHGLPERAIREFLKAERIDHSVRLFSSLRHQLLNSGGWQELERLLALFSTEDKHDNPDLALAKAWVLTYHGNKSAMIALLPSVETVIARYQDDQERFELLDGELSALRSWAALFGETEGARSSLSWAEKALQQLSPDRSYVRGIAWVFLCGSLQLLGRTKEAVERIYENLDENRKDMVDLNLLLVLNYIYLMEGNLQKLLESSDHLSRFAELANSADYAATGKLFRGIAFYHLNDLKQAGESLTHAYPYRFQMIGDHHVNLSCALCLTSHEQGEVEMARGIISALGEFAADKGNSQIQGMAEALRAELDWRTGRVQEAVHWAASQPITDPYPLTDFFEPPLVQVKILIYSDIEEHRRRAAKMLDSWQKFLEESNGIRFLIEVLALKALLAQSEGKESEALKYLADSLRIAEPGGFVRLYLDLGPMMAELLGMISRQRQMVPYVGRLLEALRKQRAERDGVGMTGTLVAGSDLLSNRERAVLELMSQRMRNDEIAAMLFISSQTVKKHAANIYQKLNVHSRREAVEKARSLTLIQ